VCRRIIMLARLVPFVLAAPARAQLCTGSPGFDRAPVQLQSSADFRDHATHITAGVALGQRNAAFGSISAGVTTYWIEPYRYYTEGEADDIVEHRIDWRGRSSTIGASVGYQLALGATRRVLLCPIATALREAGPKNYAGSGVDWSALGGSVGLRFGGEVPIAGSVTFIPWGGASVAYQRWRASSDASSNTPSDGYGVLVSGASLVLARRLALTGIMRVPVGQNESLLTFGIAAVVAIGGR
jgi:hypothetical protein